MASLANSCGVAAPLGEKHSREASVAQSRQAFLSARPAALREPAPMCHRAARGVAVRCAASGATTASPTLAPMPQLPHVWSSRAIKAFSMAELEARKLKYPTTGTEALLMGMLTEGTSMASRFLRSKGVRLMDLREETVKLLGKADMYYFSPEHPPLTPQAEAALKWAIEEHKRDSGKGEVSTEYILLGIWEQKEEGAGHKLLSNLGITDSSMQELRSLMKD